MQHKGEIVERAVRQSGFKLTEVAKRVGKSRRWMYDAFGNPDLSIDYVLQIGKVIHHDFTVDINELKGMKQSFKEPASEYVREEETVDYWKNKYYQLLEKHNSLLEKQQ